MKISFLILAITLLLYSDTTACNCGGYALDLPIEEMGWTQSKLENSRIADLIFTGTLIDFYVVENGRKVELVFELIKSYKGSSQDTMKIRTNYGHDSCGFFTSKKTNSIIFAFINENGFYYTYRYDCCKSIAEERDPKRYNKYISFLESILNMIDGQYDFKQGRSIWYDGHLDQFDTLNLIQYEIKNRKFEGTWKITNRKGQVLEEGEYKNGKKVGIWKIVSFYSFRSEGTRIKTELITYQNGNPLKSTTTIEDQLFNFETFENELIESQTIEKTYKKDKE